MGANEQLRFLDLETIRALRSECGTPVFAYSQQRLREQAEALLRFPSPFGLTARYAMKANPNRAILRLFDRCGLHIDASSGHEARRAMLAGIAPSKIMLTSQEQPADLAELVEQGVLFNATSPRQLDSFGEMFPGRDASIRINPGLGSGSINRTNVGGPGSSFGIWHESIGEVKELLARHRLVLRKIHTHIGSGSDPEVWQRVALMSLKFVREFEEAGTLSLGGGFKVGRMSDEPSTDLQEIGAPVREALEAFHAETGRKIHLEVEPGTYLTANAGALVATIHDIVRTGAEGYEFLKIDAGMTEILRPSMYGAPHPIVVAPDREHGGSLKQYLVVGHCCESGDILTPAPNDPEALAPRTLCEAQVGDALVVEGAGAYCAAMSAKNYNSFPEAAEAMVLPDGSIQLIRERQTLRQMVQNEIDAE